MTVRELRQAVIHLGIAEAFDDEVLDAVFFDAASRALVEVSRIIPRICRAVVTHCPAVPIKETESFTHTDTDIAVGACDVAAFCFYISGGSGELTVRCGDEEKKFSLNGESRRLISYKVDSRELFHGGGKKRDIELLFGGDYLYRISELTFYSCLRSDGQILPPSAGSTFDMELTVPDFCRFAMPPVYREEGEPLAVSFDYFIEGSRLILPHYAAAGDYTVSYEHMPRRVTVDTPDEEMLDCLPELCELLPLVCAYYVWLDDDPDKAGAFYARYSEQAAIKAGERKIRTSIRYKSSNGWD